MDYTVEDTNAEAMASKLSAVQKGYFVDNFAGEFVHSFNRKDIIIHRGYWARVNMFTLLIERFLNNSKGQKKQIISLGCGYDTHYYSIKESDLYKQTDFHYLEVDLPNVVRNKIRRIVKSEKVKSVIGEYKLEDHQGELYATNYTLIPCDLTQVKDFKEKLIKCGVDFTIPTFIFAECVFSYIESKYADELLQSIAQSFDMCYFSSYEMFNPTDPFGKMMVKNFERKGCPLVGIFDYPTLESQKNRLIRLGFTSCEVQNMLEIYNKYTDQKERKRIEKIEMMDEFEEWIIMQSHYFISLALKMSPIAHEKQEFQELINSLKIDMQHHV